MEKNSRLVFHVRKHACSSLPLSVYFLVFLYLKISQTWACTTSIRTTHSLCMSLKLAHVPQIWLCPTSLVYRLSKCTHRMIDRLRYSYSVGTMHRCIGNVAFNSLTLHSTCCYSLTWCVAVLHLSQRFRLTQICQSSCQTSEFQKSIPYSLSE